MQTQPNQDKINQMNRRRERLQPLFEKAKAEFVELQKKNPAHAPGSIYAAVQRERDAFAASLEVLKASDRGSSATSSEAPGVLQEQSEQNTPDNTGHPVQSISGPQIPHESQGTSETSPSSEEDTTSDQKCSPEDSPS